MKKGLRSRMPLLSSESEYTGAGMLMLGAPGYGQL